MAGVQPPRRAAGGKLGKAPHDESPRGSRYHIPLKGGAADGHRIIGSQERVPGAQGLLSACRVNDPSGVHTQTNLWGG